MLKSSLYDYNDAYNAYIHVKGTITIQNIETAAVPNNANKNLIFENCAPFTNFIKVINNTQVDDAHDIDVVILMYNLIEYSDIYLETSRSLWQYYRDEPALNNAGVIIDLPANNNNSISFKFKEKITGQTANDGTKDVEIMVPSKYLSNFWETLETSLINCKVSLQLTWSKKCFKSLVP